MVQASVGREPAGRRPLGAGGCDNAPGEQSDDEAGCQDGRDRVFSDEPRQRPGEDPQPDDHQANGQRRRRGLSAAGDERRAAARTSEKSWVISWIASGT